MDYKPPMHKAVDLNINRLIISYFQLHESNTISVSEGNFEETFIQSIQQKLYVASQLHACRNLLAAASDIWLNSVLHNFGKRNKTVQDNKNKAVGRIARIRRLISNNVPLCSCDLEDEFSSSLSSLETVDLAGDGNNSSTFTPSLDCLFDSSALDTYNILPPKKYRILFHSPDYYERVIAGVEKTFLEATHDRSGRNSICSSITSSDSNSVREAELTLMSYLNNRTGNVACNTGSNNASIREAELTLMSYLNRSYQQSGANNRQRLGNVQRQQYSFHQQVSSHQPEDFQPNGTGRRNV